MVLLHQLGETIAQHYRILGILGEGGSGTTYRAEDLQTGELVALKALSLGCVADWKAIELFEREAKVLAQLNCPGIPRYLQSFQVDAPGDRYFYIAQQLAPGESLATLVNNGWHATETEVRAIAVQLLEILVYLHQQKPPAIHRDIKPPNILRRDDGRVFLVDFGAVQQTYRSTLARSSTVVGTFGYMAPEQFTAKAVPATDLYGLGATLLFLLTHRSPAELPTKRLKIAFRSHVQISQELADWLEKMLEPDIEKRFASAKQALAVLQGKRKLRPKVESVPRGRPLFNLAIAAIGVAIVVNCIKYHYVIPDRLGWTTKQLREAVRRGEVNKVRHYLERGIDADVTDRRGVTLLHTAASMGNKEIVELLIARGADVNARGRYHGLTPLMLASKKYHTKIVKLLVDNGANINATKGYTTSAIHFVAASKTLVNNGRDKETLELLIAKGADVNARGQANTTPLHLAVRDLERVKLLITKGADINARNNRRITPLHSAVRIRNLEVVKLLVASGADVYAEDTDGRTPLHFAVLRYPNLEIVKLLIASGADVDARDTEGITPLHLVVRHVPNPKPSQNQYVKVIKLLIASGADVEVRDNSGKTPLDLARGQRLQSQEIIDLLKSRDR